MEMNEKEMNRRHSVSRTGPAVRARSPATRISELVDNRQVVDEVDLRLGVRRQPLIDEGRQGRDKHHPRPLRELHCGPGPALKVVSWHLCQRLSVVLPR